MPLVGCTQMTADMTELLQRMLPKLDDTHLAVCIAVSTSYSKHHRRIETTAKHPPPNVPKDIDGDGRKENHEHHQRHVQDGACSRVYAGGSNLVLRTTFIEKATPRCLLEKTFSSVGKRLLDA